MDRTIKNLSLALIITIGISFNVKSESELEPYEVLIKVQFSGVNRPDILQRE